MCLYANENEWGFKIELGLLQIRFLLEERLGMNENENKWHLMCLKNKNENAKEKDNGEDESKGKWRRMNEIKDFTN